MEAACGRPIALVGDRDHLIAEPEREQHLGGTGHERGDSHAPKVPQGYDRAMKAAVIYENGGPDVLRYEDVPDPECLDGCVRLDVEAISIEGGDVLARASSPPARVPSHRRATCAPAR